MALKEAAKGMGSTAPNPAVGAVIVKNGKVLSRGYHRVLGGPHAEIEALKLARGDLRGAALFVTLEPCDHFGKTPPCTQAILRSGLRHVAVGITDPHKIVAGKGIRRLRAAGLRVEVLNDPSVLEFYAPYRLFHEKGRCFVTLKLAVSIDGKISSGKSRWITGPAARMEVQRIREKMDGILVGGRTARIDNPRLTLRAAESKNRRRKLLRIILSASGRLPKSLRVLTDHQAPTWVVAAEKNSSKVDLHALTRRLAERGIVHLLVEGGAETANGFLDANLVDEICLFVSPKILGRDATPAFGRRSKPSARKWVMRDLKTCGKDFLFRFAPAKEA